MNKVDYKKELRHLYTASALDPSLVEVPPLGYLRVDGAGDPNSSRSYKEAVEALFSLAYTIKFAVKKRAAMDYVVMPLEGLWWVDDMKQFDVMRKDEWQWTLMIMQPAIVAPSVVETCRSELARKKELPALAKVQFARFEEGRAAQVLHVGPFSEEGPTIERLHRFIEGQGLRLAGKHHEIYLSDIRRAAPANWKTIIRQAAE